MPPRRARATVKKSKKKEPEEQLIDIFSIQEARQKLEEFDHSDKIIEKFEKYFEQWNMQLRNGFNLLFYGIGSKRKLVSKFAAECLTFSNSNSMDEGKKFHGSGIPVIAIDGYKPKINLKTVCAFLFLIEYWLKKRF